MATDQLEKGRSGRMGRLMVELNGECVDRLDDLEWKR